MLKMTFLAASWGHLARSGLSKPLGARKHVKTHSEPLGRSNGHLGARIGRLGATWVPKGAEMGRSGATWAPLERSNGLLG